ncbi:sugar porter family MFS transporter [Kribbella jejuensis]|uniref:sugar porter family MFS transporter n=1 Tax=Kribbella jejuensis TaxID=236068 RepID=UPI0023568338|nr:sugar porter family MFS transporter [Kribbella jejuensis]
MDLGGAFGMAPQQESAAGVLDHLDTRVPTSFYWSLTLLATVGGFLFGYDTANIGSVVNFLPWNLGSLALGYLVAGASIGAAVGALAAGPTSDRLGRKSLLVVDAAIYALGALLSAFAWDAWVLLVARTLIGLAIGADSAIATAYIAEYAPKARRGALGILQQWMITVGILISYLIALAVLIPLPQHVHSFDWRLLLGLGAVPAVFALVLRTRMPESPRWLMRQGRYDDAHDALAKLDIDVSAEQIERSAREVDERESQAGRPARNWTRGVKRALIVVCVFFAFQQITGINLPFYYGPKLLQPYLQNGGDKVQAAVAAVAITAGMSVVNVVATYFAFKFIDRVGRRKLALGGYAVMAVAMLIGAAGVAFTGGLTRIILIMIGLNVFIAAFAIGVGGTGWLIQGEYFPTAVRGRAAALGAAADWIANFALILLVPTMLNGFGLAWLMVLFAVLSAVALLFVNSYIPETKELSVEEITEIFERQAAS